MPPPPPDSVVARVLGTDAGHNAVYGPDVDATDDELQQPRDASDSDAEARLATHGLISTQALATHYGITLASVRRLMSDHHIGEVRGYPAEQALNIVRPGRHPAPGPGRGHRKNTAAQDDPPATGST